MLCDYERITKKIDNKPDLLCMSRKRLSSSIEEYFGIVHIELQIFHLLEATSINEQSTIADSTVGIIVILLSILKIFC